MGKYAGLAVFGLLSGVFIRSFVAVSFWFEVSILLVSVGVLLWRGSSGKKFTTAVFLIFPIFPIFNGNGLGNGTIKHIIKNFVGFLKVLDVVLELLVKLNC